MATPIATTSKSSSVILKHKIKYGLNCVKLSWENKMWKNLDVTLKQCSCGGNTIGTLVLMLFGEYEMKLRSNNILNPKTTGL